MSTPCARPSRVAVPIHVRRALIALGKVKSRALFGISPGNFDEVISVNGRVQGKILAKIEGTLFPSRGADEDES